MVVPEADREAVRDIIRDPFFLDFLAADPVRERDLSKAGHYSVHEFPNIAIWVPWALRAVGVMLDGEGLSAGLCDGEILHKKVKSLLC